STTVDTENLLSKKEANEIKNLVGKAHFFELPSKLSQPSKTTKGAADYFVYKITIQNNNNDDDNNNKVKKNIVWNAMILICNPLPGRLLIF
ncbi:MAG TPA: protealysin inhibitor emfourin, partial [Nitrososphaeraceae archaeon]|nr:protealysin inhibitor emfourin [Nitrososphaeraceae archaeon]